MSNRKWDRGGIELNARKVQRLQTLLSQLRSDTHRQRAADRFLAERVFEQSVEKWDDWLQDLLAKWAWDWCWDPKITEEMHEVEVDGRWIQCGRHPTFVPHGALPGLVNWVARNLQVSDSHMPVAYFFARSQVPRRVVHGLLRTIRCFGEIPYAFSEWRGPGLPMRGYPERDGSGTPLVNPDGVTVPRASLVIMNMPNPGIVDLYDVFEGVLQLVCPAHTVTTEQDGAHLRLPNGDSPLLFERLERSQFFQAVEGVLERAVRMLLVGDRLVIRSGRACFDGDVEWLWPHFCEVLKEYPVVEEKAFRVVCNPDSNFVEPRVQELLSQEWLHVFRKEAEL